MILYFLFLIRNRHCREHALVSYVSQGKFTYELLIVGFGYLLSWKILTPPKRLFTRPVFASSFLPKSKALPSSKPSTQVIDFDFSITACITCYCLTLVAKDDLDVFEKIKSSLVIALLLRVIHRIPIMDSPSGIYSSIQQPMPNRVSHVTSTNKLPSLSSSRKPLISIPS